MGNCVSSEVNRVISKTTGVNINGEIAKVCIGLSVSTRSHFSLSFPCSLENRSVRAARPSDMNCANFYSMSS